MIVNYNRKRVLGDTASFIMSVKTDNAGTSGSTQFTIPTTGVGYSYNIDTVEHSLTGQTGDVTLTFAVAGTYDVKISGTFPRIYFNNTGDNLKLLDVKSWGAIAWSSFNNAFVGCINLTGTYSDTPDLTNVTDLSRMLLNCSGFQGVLEDWDTSGITDMSQMLFGTSYNQTLNGLNTSSVLNMSQMFRNINIFDQDISGWDINQVSNFNQFMLGADPLSTTNYDAILIVWETQLPWSATAIDFGTSQYTLGGAAETARTSIISSGVTITDGGGI